MSDFVGSRSYSSGRVNRVVLELRHERPPPAPLILLTFKDHHNNKGNVAEWLRRITRNLLDMIFLRERRFESCRCRAVLIWGCYHPSAPTFCLFVRLPVSPHYQSHTVSLPSTYTARLTWQRQEVPQEPVQEVEIRSSS